MNQWLVSLSPSIGDRGDAIHKALVVGWFLTDYP